MTNRFKIVIFSLAVALGAFGIWQSLLPYFAERHYKAATDFQNRYNDLPHAISEMEMAVKYAPLEAFYNVILGRMYEQYSETVSANAEKLIYIAKADKAYKTLIALDDLNPWYHNRVAAVNRLFYMNGVKDKPYAEMEDKEIRLAAKLDHNNPLFLLNLAFHEQNMLRIEAAKSLYRQVLHIDPRINEAAFNLGVLAIQDHKLTAAYSYFLQVYRNDSQFNNVVVNLAQTAFNIGKKDEALRLLKQQVDSHPYDFNAIVSYVELLQRMNRGSELLEALEKVTLRFPEEIRYRQAYIQILLQQHQNQKAADQIRILNSLQHTQQSALPNQ